ncbi:MAG TPA: trypsin-like peptidase domain-containing protein [Candidatus Saccharimonadales bacterium]|nr:trypsin-like peptidase domain-containing protein [Candidatus Saccharimonadales bacterium]
MPKINQKAATLLLMLIVSVAAGFAGGYYGNKHGADSNDNVKQAFIDNEGDLISGIAKDVGPSVVSVEVESTGVNNTFFGPQTFTRQAAGTGFIVDREGVIVTNRHVVPEGIESVAVTLSDGTRLNDVSVVGRTTENDTLDIAFLKINDRKGKTLSPVKLGDSSKTEVGDRVIAIGNALGQFENTVTSGIISGYGRDIQAGGVQGTPEVLQDLFQTDAAINEGNSGGPLVNFNGEVIGINTAIAGGAQNIGFAIPINSVKGLIDSVLEGGKLLRPYLGVRYISLSDDYAYQFNLDQKRGAYLAPNLSGGPAVIPGSPAAKAGLKEKDIITKVGDKAVDEKNGLSSILSQYSVGDTVKLTIVRGDKELTLDITLAKFPEADS